jgi:hypothetical protein
MGKGERCIPYKKTRQEEKNLYNENAEGIERLLAEAQASPL